MNIFILDDIYTKDIYPKLSQLLPHYTYPIQDNILDPLEYIDQITNNDIVLLDNFFRSNTGREEPLGVNFLDALADKKLSPKVICISDYGKQLLEKYDTRGEGYSRGVVLDFVATKDAHDIAQVIKKIIPQRA